MVLLHFISSGADTDPHDVHLARMEAKSHAARVAWYRNKRNSRLKAQQGLPLRDTRPDFVAATPVPLVTGVLLPTTGPLDPFLNLAERLSAVDQERLQRFLVSDRMQLSLSHQGWCATHRFFFPTVAASGICLQATMLMLDMIYHAESIAIERRRKVLLRRAIRLARNLASFADAQTAIDLAVLAMAEDRAGNVIAAISHCAALKAWVRIRGGFACLHGFDVALTIMLVTVLINVEFPLFQKRSEMEPALARITLPRGRCCDAMYQQCQLSTERPHLAVLYLFNVIAAQPESDLFAQLVKRQPSTECTGHWSALHLVAVAVRKTDSSHLVDYGAMIEFVHLLGRTSQRTQLRVAKWLFANLSGQETDVFDLEQLKMEIDGSRKPIQDTSMQILGDCGLECQSFKLDFSRLIPAIVKE